jgi:hypothetical protein
MGGATGGGILITKQYFEYLVFLLKIFLYPSGRLPTTFIFHRLLKSNAAERPVPRITYMNKKKIFFKAI